MSFFPLNEANINGLPMQALMSSVFKHEQKQLILILCENTLKTMQAYIAGMNSGHAVMLLAADLNEELLAQVIAQYQPKWIVGREAYEGYRIEEDKLVREAEVQVDIHSDLALLLSTSGTTGS